MNNYKKITMSITIVLILVTLAVSYQGFTNVEFFNRFKHNPYAESHYNQGYRLLTHGFLHADWIHLLINMFVLYNFGSIVESEFDDNFGPILGKVYFAGIYLLTIPASSLSTHYKYKDAPHYSAIGASGATSGMMFIFILFYPWEKILIYGILEIPGIICGILYLIYSSWASKNSNDNIGHDAHLYGAIFGFVFAIILKTSFLYTFLNELKHIPFLN